MKVKVYCEFDLDTTILNKEGDIETDTQQYKDYIFFLLNKGHSKLLKEFFDDSKNNSVKDLYQESVYKRLSKQIDETKQMMDTMKIDVELKH